MADIREKIKKLLALGSSSNEHEARSAMLKAKQLMMENKISESEFIDEKAELNTITCEDVKWTTDSGEIWMVDLCTMLANNYCCVASWRTFKGTRTHTLVVTGMGTDVDICKNTIEFALGFIKGKIKILQRKYRTQDAKSIASSYAKGFILGLELELEAQKEQHPEWGLMVVNSKEVEDYRDQLSNRSVKTKRSNFNPMAYASGQMDGKAFTAKRALEVVN